MGGLSHIDRADRRTGILKKAELTVLVDETCGDRPSKQGEEDDQAEQGQVNLVIRLSGRHISSIRSRLRKYAIRIYVGIRCDVDVVSDAKVVHCTSSLNSLRLVEMPRRRQRSMLAISLAPSGITEMIPTISLRHSSASGQGGCGTFQISSCLDIAIQINLGVWCGHINSGKASLARRDESRKDWRRVRMPEGTPAEYNVLI